MGFTILVSSGCSGRIIPPPVPETPRAVFVLDHGQHSSLVLEDKHGSLTRYSYGDWRYYAEGKTGFWSGFRALFIPTQAALGRKQLAGPATLDNVHQQIKIGVINTVSLKAEASVVDTLQHQLDLIYQQNQHAKRYRYDFDLEFVPHPRPYSLRYNSNQAVGQWLTTLGSEIQGWPLLSNWTIQH
ncbi:DUF2459 domain-containing protein [Methylophaga pinxianii]|uniref:DUF2459 domain-containing protein n=1 Tax=Methylophaga pinxianii TaxID=2881052 RepID=UPI001CF31410|nr:DUF2459 domain-containing protein [Methylophaga pinxianii]MCB2426342.1 DUF2459 domain-containing protein [Methylophaga pinxianii]UPH46839.1 DUF2459 domain-containing protein [Methylophaga pinxianii]